LRASCLFFWLAHLESLTSINKSLSEIFSAIVKNGTYVIARFVHCSESPIGADPMSFQKGNGVSGFAL